MNTTTVVETAIWTRGKAGTVEIHRDGCKALNKATGRSLWIKIDADEVSDLVTRGYPVRRCRCTKGGAA
jgi:hypothetical protein